jgi:transposase
LDADPPAQGVKFARRNTVATKSPIAEEAVKRIAELYAVEPWVRGEPAEERQRVRHKQNRPLVEAVHVWLNEQLSRIPGASTLAKAIRCALNHWNGLVLFLEDGRLELDTNTVERAIRLVTITRKNAPFAGNDNGGRH